MPYTDNKLASIKAKPSVSRVRGIGSGPDEKGLGLLISPKGAKSFFLGYTSPVTSKRTELNLGRFPAMKLTEARAITRDHRALLNGGFDPVIEVARQAEEAEAKLAAIANRGTVGQLFNLYIQKLEQDGKRSAGFVRNIYKSHIDKVIGDMFPADVKRKDFKDVLKPIASRGKYAYHNAIITYLSAAFRFGQDIEDDTELDDTTPDFGLEDMHISLPKRIKKNKDKSEIRSLSAKEIKHIWADFSPENIRIDHALAVKLILSTGQRVEEVLLAKWSEFDFEASEWVLPGIRRKTRNKTIEDHLVPLTPFHIALLKELRGFSGTSEYLFPRFPNGNDPRGFDTLRNAIRRYCEVSGFSHFTSRDLRRTWKTLAASIGVGYEMRNKIQGHNMGVIEEGYNCHDYKSEKRASMEKWCRSLEGFIEGGPAKVVRLGK